MKAVVVTTKRLFVFCCALILGASILSFTPANADELSDAQNSLSISQAKLNSLQISLTNANDEISGYALKISTTDSTTVEGQSAIEKFTTALEAARAAKSVLESQIAPLQTEIANLTIKIAALIAAINGANNCPADWGLTPSSFIEGIETGVFNYNSKIGSELAKDPRNIVISSSVQFSKDGSTWKTYREITANNWVQYAQNSSGPKGSYYSRFVFLSDVYEMLRNNGVQVRISTILDKQGCVTHNIIGEAKPLTIAATPFAKTTIDELYVAYPQAFPNYQVRDQAKSVVAAIPAEFTASAGNGSQYNFSKGNFSYFQIVTYPRGGACSGDFNYVTVNIGASCELGIYWLWNNSYKYIDSVSTIGGASEAQKQQLAILAQAKPLQITVQKIVSNLDAASAQIQALNAKYSADWSKAGQEALDQYVGSYQSSSDNIATLSKIRQQFITFVNSGYSTPELMTIFKETDYSIAVALKVFDSLITQAKNAINTIQQYLNGNSPLAKAELDRSISIKSQAQRDASNASSMLNEVGSFSNNPDYAKNYKMYFTKYMPGLQSSLTDANNIYSSIKTWLAVAQKNASAASNSTDSQVWQNVISNYSSSLSMYATVVNIYTKAITILKNPPVISTIDASSEVNGALNMIKNGEKIAPSVEAQYQQFVATAKAKGSLFTAASRSTEIANLKGLSEKYFAEVNSIVSRKEIADQKVTQGDADSETWKSVSDLLSKAAGLYTRIYKAYMGMLSLAQSDSLNTTDSQANSGPTFVDVAGEEESAAGSVTYKKDKQGRYLISVSSNQENTDFVVKAIKSKSKAIIFNATSDADGNIYLRTTRKLAGYVLQLVLDGEVLSKTATLK